MMIKKSTMHTPEQDKARQGVGVKNLSLPAARRKYPYKPCMGDCRAFSYNPKTGRWVYT